MPSEKPISPELPLALVQSPSLIDACDQFELAPLASAQPEHACLSALGEHQDKRLGRYFEDLVLAVAATLPTHQLLCRNLAIRSPQRTLGELDAIFYNRTKDQYEHWEITLKFYLGLHRDHWPGPDPEDTFHKRLRRLQMHQFPLDQTPACIKTMAPKGIPRIDKRYLLSRGRLFYPSDVELPSPTGAHPDHDRGTWWRVDQLPEDWQWQPLAKSQWLFPSAMSDKGTSRVASPDMLDYVQRSRSPVMVNAFSSPHANPTPGFVVPATWLSDAEHAYTNT